MSSPTAISAAPEPACPRCGRAIPAAAPLGACPHCLLAAGLPSLLGTPAPGAPPPPSPAELAPEFPALEILELLGRGGMGAVYKARQRDLGRLVALKILRPGLDATPGFSERFAREARALAGLNHPGIVTLYEFGRTPAGRYFILMEFVDGVNLRGLLAAGRVAPREALAIVPPLCDALQYAHDRGLVHRDIKPENILVDRLGRVKIADFGIARLASAEGAAPHAATETEVAGTPAYMAPEQKERPDAVDHRADLYALGVVLYQMLTGELPSPGQLQPPSHRVEIDVRLDEIVLRALEKDPALRYAAVSEFKTRIETVVHTSPPTPSASPSAAIVPPNPAPVTSLPRFPLWAVFAGLALLHLAFIPLTARYLPATVASHFDSDGRANGWMPRIGYLVFIGVMPCVLGSLFYLPAWLISRLPARFVNLPNRDHWLAPERRAETCRSLRQWMAGPACLLVVFFAELHLAAVFAHTTTPPRLSTGLLVGPLIGFFSALMVWIVGLVLRFAETNTLPGKLRKTSIALGCSAIIALTLPAVPLVSRALSLRPAAAPAPLAPQEEPPSPDTSAIPPILRALDWQDNANAGKGSAWLPDGRPAPASEQRPPAAGLSITPRTPFSDAPRFLSLWFSHPGFDALSLAEVRLIDPATGEPVENPHGAATGFARDPAHPSAAAWITVTQSPGTFGKLPARVEVRLRFSAGPWRAGEELPLTGRVRSSLSDGASVGSPGQDADNRAFVEIVRDTTQDTQAEQIDFLAITREGKRLTRSGFSIGSMGSMRVERTTFDTPLSNLRAFAIRRRPIRTQSWTVPLQEDRAPGDQRAFRLDRAGDTMSAIIGRRP